MADIQSIGVPYERQPRLWYTTFSPEESNAIMDRVVAAVTAVYPTANVPVPRLAAFEGKRYESRNITGDFFEIALQYLPREGKGKDKVVARVRINRQQIDTSHLARLDELVRNAMK